MTQRLFIKIKKDLIPQLKDRYPMIYLEYGRLEVDDSSIKWISSDGDIVAIPVASVSSILLGPGTVVTHAAMRTLADTNCVLCWVGEDSLKSYCASFTPTSDTRRLLHQISMQAHAETRLDVAKRMYRQRFPEANFDDKTLPMLMGMEGVRVRNLYKSKSEEYGVPWGGRDYIPGQSDKSNAVNRNLTILNSYLYGIVTSAIYTLGFSPRIGFIHSGSPLPFTYDIADLYKSSLTIDLAFKTTLEKNNPGRKELANIFCRRIIEENLLERISRDINFVLGLEK